MPNLEAIVAAARAEQKLDQRGVDNPVARSLIRSTISYSKSTNTKAKKLKDLLFEETDRNVSTSQLFAALVNAALPDASTKPKAKAKPKAKKKPKSLGADIAKLAG